MKKFGVTTRLKWLAISGVILVSMNAVQVQAAEKKPPEKRPSSYAPVVIDEEFGSVVARMKAAKPGVMKRQMDLLQARYDLSNRPAAGVTMSRGKPVQEGVRAKLPKNLSWERLGAMTPEEIRAQDVFPAGFLPLPHPNHAEGGMVFPQFHIDEINKQEQRDLTRDRKSTRLNSSHQ